MTVLIATFETQPPTRVTITSKKFGDFTVFVRNPTYAEILEDEFRQVQQYTEEDKPAAYRERYLARLSLIVDWSDVETISEKDGSHIEVPFTITNLKQLLRLDRDIARQLNDAINAAYNQESIVGESEPNPDDTSQDPQKTSQHEPNKLSLGTPTADPTKFSVISSE